MHRYLKGKPKNAIEWNCIAAIGNSVFYDGSICGIYGKETPLRRRTINKYVSGNINCKPKMAIYEFRIY
jgi:hypothetical protein